MTASRPPGASAATRRSTKRVEPVELAVHPDPQRLKRARRRIDPLPPAARRPRAARPTASVGRRRQRAAVARRARSRARRAATGAPRRTGRSRPPASPRRPSPAARPASVRSIGSIRMSSGPACRKLNPRAGVVELQRRHAEIHQHAVDRSPARARASTRRQLAVVGVHELDPIARAPRAARAPARARAASRSIPITRPAPASSSAARVPAEPHRAVDVDAVRPRRAEARRPRRRAPGSWRALRSRTPRALGRRRR